MAPGQTLISSPGSVLCVSCILKTFIISVTNLLKSEFSKKDLKPACGSYMFTLYFAPNSSHHLDGQLLNNNICIYIALITVNVSQRFTYHIHI